MKSFKCLIVASALMLFVNSLKSQNVNYIPFDSIDPSNENFENLHFLKNEIGDKQIVMIGEQDHSAGASIDAKARICNYLIKEMVLKLYCSNQVFMM